MTRAMVEQAVQAAMKKERQQAEIDRRTVESLKTKNAAKYGSATRALDVDGDDDE